MEESDMSNDAPLAEGVPTPPELPSLRELMPVPTRCHEYLGVTVGYCDRAPQIPDLHGRRFCTGHALERDLR